MCHFIPGKSRLVEIATWTNQMIYTLINLINETSVKKYFQMYRFFSYFSLDLVASTNGSKGNLPVPKVFVGVLTLMKIRSASLMASEMAVEKN